MNFYFKTSPPFDAVLYNVDRRGMSFGFEGHCRNDFFTARFAYLWDWFNAFDTILVPRHSALKTDVDQIAKCCVFAAIIN